MKICRRGGEEIMGMINAETLKKIYRKALLEAHEQNEVKKILFNFMVDATKLTLTLSEAITILVNNKTGLLEEQEIYAKLSEGVIDYLMTLDVDDIYATANKQTRS